MSQSTVGGNLYTVRLLAGEHQGRYKRYKAGDCFQTRQPLHKMFVNKFELVPSSPAPVEDGPGADSLYSPEFAQNARADAQRDQQRNAPYDPYGLQSPQAEQPRSPYVPYDFASATNVTHMFKDAKALGLAVYKDSSGGYAVAEADVPVPANLAPSVLSSKKKVNEFLASMQSPDLGD